MRAACSILAFSGALLRWGQADAADAAVCPVEVSGTGSSEWSQAARQLATALPSQAEGDCAAVQVELGDASALVIFTTADGRRAERRVTEPDDLLSTVYALQVAGPSPQAVAPPDVDAPELDSTAAPATASPLVDRDAPEGSNDGTYFFSLLGGARGGEARLTSPILRGGLSLVSGDWELGLLGGVDFHYAHLFSDKEPSSDTSVWMAGIGVGRRQPVGPTALLLGTRVYLAGLSQHETTAEQKERNSGRAELRLAAYTGLVSSRSSHYRFRADLSAEIVPHDVGADDDGAEAALATPWWALGLTVGVEMGTP